jgi:hypothetical protein
VPVTGFDITKDCCAGPCLIGERASLRALFYGRVNDGTQHKLVDAKALLEIVFDERARPCERWLRNMVRAGAIPSHPMGGRVFFDPHEVRAAILSSGRKVRAKGRTAVDKLTSSTTTAGTQN